MPGGRQKHSVRYERPPSADRRRRGPIPIAESMRSRKASCASHERLSELLLCGAGGLRRSPSEARADRRRKTPTDEPLASNGHPSNAEIASPRASRVSALLAADLRRRARRDDVKRRRNHRETTDETTDSTADSARRSIADASTFDVGFGFGAARRGVGACGGGGGRGDGRSVLASSRVGGDDVVDSEAPLPSQ